MRSETPSSRPPFTHQALRASRALAVLLAAAACGSVLPAHAQDGAPAASAPAAPRTTTPLIDAAYNRDHDRAVALIAKGADVRAKSADGTTALHWAAHNGDVDLVKRLIKAGADVSAVNDYGSSPLQEGAVEADTPILEALVKAGVNVDSPNPEGQTVLMVVARTGNTEAAKFLLSHGAKVNAVEQWGGQSALMWAAAQRQPQMIQLLLSHGAEVNARSAVRDWQRRVTAEGRPKIMNHGGFTALHFAAREGCIECAKILIKGGANLNALDPDDTTPLVLALLNMHYSFAAYLISAGADLNRWDFFGQTPLYVAIDMNTLPTGGRPDLPSEDNLTGLQVAELLLAKGADPNIQLKLRPQYRNGVFDRGGDQVLSTGATALLLAAKDGDAAAVQLLLKYHAMVDLPNAEGVTPLMAAAGMGHSFNPTRGRYKTDDEAVACVKLLYAAGGSISAHDRTGMTALHAAAKLGWDDTAKLLVADGAQPQVADSKGLHPIDYALGHYERAFLEPQPQPHDSTVKLLTDLIVASTGQKPVMFAGDLSRAQKGVGGATNLNPGNPTSN